MKSIIYAIIFMMCLWSAKAQPPGDPSSSPLLCLDEDDEKLSFPNGPCKTNDNCYNFYPNSSICKNSVCVCDEGFVVGNQTSVTGEDRLICVYAPSAYDPCTTVCQKPYTCAEPSASDKNNNTSLIFAMPGQKLCLCLHPYKEKDGFCYLECHDGEAYSMFSNNCSKHCSANEINEWNPEKPELFGKCTKMSNLGEPCDSKELCEAPYSVCQGGVCTCGTGFTRNGSACVTDLRNCPVGDLVRVNNAVVECSVLQKSRDITKLRKPSPEYMALSTNMQNNYPPEAYIDDFTDTCADGQFCVVEAGYGYLEGATGHCCQLPKPACPIGSPHPTATCGNPLSLSKLKTQNTNNQEYCPFETHACQHFAFGSGFEYDLCCPLACTPRQILINGKCYPLREIGEQCNYDKQCNEFRGVCVNGTCACGKNTTLRDKVVYKFCETPCKEDVEREIAVGQCAPILNLGDPCDSKALFENCPNNAHCSPKTNKCICDCGQIKLNEKNCGPPPRCSNPTSNTTDFGKTNLTGATFCVVPGIHDKPLFNTAAKECPKNDYCAEYLPNLGFCCPKPEPPLCSNGKIAGAKCDPRSGETACKGAGQVCEKYLDVAGPDDPNVGYACCSYE